MQESDATDASVDPLLKRLQDKYTKQRSEQLAERRRRLEKELFTQASRNSALLPSVELLSDETALAFNELDAFLASEPTNRRALEQLRAIRTAVNQELRQSLAYMEEGYSSAYHTLLSEAKLMKAGSEFAASSSPVPISAATAHTTRLPGPSPAAISTPATVDRALTTLSASLPPPTVDREVLLQSSTEERRGAVKRAVVGKTLDRIEAHSDRLSRKLTIQEALSSVTGLFAESLATLLHCEVVRVYLYDDSGSLHCCAAFPSGDPSGDPMRATYKEVMLAKELHHAVCVKGIAVNGSEAQYSMLSRRDVEAVLQEADASGWGSLRSCLIFPILFHEGSGGATSGRQRRSAGMIHAVNKMNLSPAQAARFTEDDEVLMSMAARTLGCMLTRYPVHYFTLRVGDAVRAVTHPNEGPLQPRAHLPEWLPDTVEDASIVGMQAMLAPQPIMILRAPVSEVYQTRTQRSRNRKLGNLVANDNALSSVEFNLSAVSELWQAGMEDNVLMHSQYRALNEQLTHTRMLMRNVLDGLAAARTMRDAADIAHYLQRLELLARGDKLESLTELISGVLLQQVRESPALRSSVVEPLATHDATPRGAAEGREGVNATSQMALGTPTTLVLAPDTSNFLHSPLANAGAAASPCPAEAVDPFLTAHAAAVLLRDHQRLNAPVASRLHVDGPEGIRTYSSDPASKRRQMELISEMQRERVAEQRNRLREEHRYLRVMASTAAARAGGRSGGHAATGQRSVASSPSGGVGLHEPVPVTSRRAVTNRPFQV